jgi:hypothetical protein
VSIESVAAQADQGDTTIRWDLIRGDASGNIRAGGTQAAAAADGSTLALTGFGTFQLGDPEDVTGGGTWKLGTSSGTYQVTRFVRFTFAPCTVPTCVSGFGGTDLVGNDKDSRAGLVVLEINCVPPVGGPPSIFEGITTTKGFVNFATHGVAVDTVDANHTLFHVQAATE